LTKNLTNLGRETWLANLWVCGPNKAANLKLHKDNF